MSHVAKSGRVLGLAVLCLAWGLAGGLSEAQAPTDVPLSKGVSATSLERGIDLASTGHCIEALAILKKGTRQITDKKLRYQAAMATAQCGMVTDQEDAVVESLLWLNREFPSDTKVLYLTTRYYSELANRAARLACPAQLAVQTVISPPFRRLVFPPPPSNAGSPSATA